jgi:threonine dehydrogenase-like Zn-dependent dehydrogenase
LVSTAEPALADDDVAIELEGTNGAAAIGRVIATGVRAQSLAGKRVLVGPFDPCGECDVCRRGGAAVCPTARRRTAPLTSPIVAAARWVIALGEPDGIDVPSPAGAVVAGDLALAYTLYARTGVGPRDPVVVVGDSPIAGYLRAVLRAKGITPGEGSPDEIRAAFQAQGFGQRPWRVIATSPASVALAVELCGPRSTLTVLAPIPSLPGILADREVSVIPVAGAHPDLVVEICALVMKGELQISLPDR